MIQSRSFPNVVGNEGFLFTEASGQRSRGKGILGPSQDVKPGTPLGRITASKQLVRYAPGATDGSQTFACLSTHAGKTGAGQTLEIGVIDRDAEVNLSLLDYGTLTDPQILALHAAMDAQGIRPRQTIRKGVKN